MASIGVITDDPGNAVCLLFSAIFASTSSYCHPFFAYFISIAPKFKRGPRGGNKSR